jgi:hypothetical protein
MMGIDTILCRVFKTWMPVPPMEGRNELPQVESR